MTDSRLPASTSSDQTSPVRLPAAPAPFSTTADDRRFWEFFTVNIRNANTRRAYLRAAVRFAGWCEGRAL